MPNLRQQTQQVLANQLDYMDDPPPSDLLGQVRAQAKDRFKTQDALSTYFFFLNTREKPFDNAQARAAVNYAVDRRAIVRLWGGLFKPGCYFIPAGMPGHPETPCPYGDPNQPPDLEKAKQLVQESGTAGASVTVWGNTESPTDKVTQYYADVLNSIGYKATPKLIDSGVYLATVGNQKTRAQTGLSNWFGDYLHPVNFMQLLNGNAITQTNNKNYSNVDDPELTRRIEELNRDPDLEQTAEQWAELDEYAIAPEHAYTVAYGQSMASIFMSERMNFENCATFHTLFQNDFSSWCLK
jgi:peptide/nickel transport system substrate-binding protein